MEELKLIIENKYDIKVNSIEQLNIKTYNKCYKIKSLDKEYFFKAGFVSKITCQYSAQRACRDEKGHNKPDHHTNSISGPRAKPGCTKYQCPNNMASLIAPKNSAPISTRATDNHAGSPALMPPATNATTPKRGANKSRCAGNSGPSEKVCSSLSMPVMAATRAERRSSVPR